ncbi:MAG: hypothetical protein HY298_10870 [Verrucomicrobia bacterium]|nr:hypothetical protein [Verrucomicrobiota bacterium]
MKFLLPSRTNPRQLCWVACLFLATLFMGCRKEEIRVYRVPKEKAETVASAIPPSETSAPRLQWKLPEGWTEQAPSKMRVASFSITGKDGQQADVSVIPLSGISGKEVEVVNLWRDQVKLPAIGEEEAKRDVQQVEIAGAKAELYEMVSREPLLAEKSPTRILVATCVRDDTSWFFKMTGADALVREQKPVFLEFLKSVAFHEGGAPGQLASARRPISTNVKEVPHGATGPEKTVWNAPANWQELPPGQMLLAKFLATGDGGTKAEITVSVFPGDVGGLLANVNRWRNQIGLTPVAQPELDKLVNALDATIGKAMLVDMTGTKSNDGKKARLIGAILPQGDRTWFYKILGDELVVAREKDAFIKFVQTMKLPDAP